MEIVMRHLNLNLYEVPPIPPANPIGDRHNDAEIADDDDDFLGPL